MNIVPTDFVPCDHLFVTDPGEPPAEATHVLLVYRQVPGSVATVRPTLFYVTKLEALFTPHGDLHAVQGVLGNHVVCAFPTPVSYSLIERRRAIVCTLGDMVTAYSAERNRLREIEKTINQELKDAGGCGNPDCEEHSEEASKKEAAAKAAAFEEQLRKQYL